MYLFLLNSQKKVPSDFTLGRLFGMVTNFVITIYCRYSVL